MDEKRISDAASSLNEMTRPLAMDLLPRNVR
jgi:hypothetical protein